MTSVMRTDDRLADLPGGALVQQGLSDLQGGRHTIPACLVAIARSRFERAGLLPAHAVRERPEAERELYRLLRAEGGDAYSRYNALVRELVSFAQTLERQHRVLP
jgi:hypothetical protein